MSGSTPEIIALIGVPFSGKSTVAAALAQQIGWSLFDTDEMVKGTAGSSIADLYLDGGEARYRSLELQEIHRALDEPPAVVAVGSGAPGNQEVRDLLSGATVVWLRISAAESGKRAGLHAPRPAALGNLRSQWNRMLKERNSMYESLADIIVDADKQDPDEITTEILAHTGAGSDR